VAESEVKKGAGVVPAPTDDDEENPDEENLEDDVDGIDDVIPNVGVDNQELPLSATLFDQLQTKEQRDAAATRLRWFRGQVVQMEVVYIICSLAGQVASKHLPTAELSITLISVKHPGKAMAKWRDVVLDLVEEMNSPEVTPQQAFEAIVNSDKKFKSPDLEFKGTLHCEACLASLARSGLANISRLFEVLLPVSLSLDRSDGWYLACQQGHHRRFQTVLPCLHQVVGCAFQYSSGRHTTEDIWIASHHLCLFAATVAA
jgi:hypothetical protein